MAMFLAASTGAFDIKESASIGIIGAADGPTSIYAATRFAPNLLGPISVAAYSYMALVPMIQPPIIRALTTKKNVRYVWMLTMMPRCQKGADSIPHSCNLDSWDYST